MNNLPDWPAPQKPVEIAYNRLLTSILDNTLPAGSLLPAERQLAESLGVTRSTLREAMQRLSANGLVEVQHGKPTRVRDIWKEGNMNTLTTMIHSQYARLNPVWVPNILEVRLALAPAYARSAVSNNPDEVVKLINRISADLQDNAEAYAQADWTLHYELTVLSNNPVYTLFLNGFFEYYLLMAEKYFQHQTSRNSSATFYTKLKEAAAEKNAHKAHKIMQKVMQESLDLWQHLQS